MKLSDYGRGVFCLVGQRHTLPAQELAQSRYNHHSLTGNWKLMRKLACALAFSLACIKAQAEDRSDFFETKIRPLLIARCASCHGDKVQMAGVQLTSKVDRVW
jgi:hypothetical protein